jgi:hypothetical protein
MKIIQEKIDNKLTQKFETRKKGIKTPKRKEGRRNNKE